MNNEDIQKDLAKSIHLFSLSTALLIQLIGKLQTEIEKSTVKKLNMDDDETNSLLSEIEDIWEGSMNLRDRLYPDLLSDLYMRKLGKEYDRMIDKTLAKGGVPDLDAIFKNKSNSSKSKSED